jgi:hypothetical protein
MAEQLNNVVQAPGSGPPNGIHPPSAVSGMDNLPLFRFGLRQVFLFVAAVSFLLAALVSLNGFPVLALLLAALVVAFHVFGTALGSRLRDEANRFQACDAGSSMPAQPPILKPLPLPWYGRSNASFAWLPRLVAAAVFFGGALGAVLLTVTIGHRISSAGLVVGTISLAALSGWFAFLAGSFIAIVRGGLSEAVAEQDSGQARSSALR